MPQKAVMQKMRVFCFTEIILTSLAIFREALAAIIGMASGFRSYPLAMVFFQSAL